MSRVIDLSGVVAIDRRGEQVLRKMLSQDVVFITCGVYTKHLLDRLRNQAEFPSREPHPPERSRDPR